MKKLIIILACGMLMSTASFAQTLKIGYIDSRELLVAMPEVKKADSALQIYAKAFQDQLLSMQQELEKKGKDYQANEKTMTEPVKEVKQKEVYDLQSRMEGLQSSAQEKIQSKKEELYKPIIDKATKAVKDVAKEKAYDYVFDLAQGSLLVYRDGDNMMPFVKAKLGLK